MKEIILNPLDPRSINDAITQLKQYDMEFREKEREFIRRLMEIGVSVASSRFSAAEYMGENDVRITTAQGSNVASIIAYGQAVGFIEFGTGIKYREYDSSKVEYTPPARGSYGKGQGANPKGWWFGRGKHSYGNPPAEAMLAARDTMVERVAQIAREVWK